LVVVAQGALLLLLLLEVVVLLVEVVQWLCFSVTLRARVGGKAAAAVAAEGAGLAL
jgi:hypothetical protein